MHGLDRCLELEGAGAGAANAAPNDCMALADHRAIPLASILIAQAHKRASRSARRHARLTQQHQCEQANCLGLIRHELDQSTSQSKRLAPQHASLRIIDAGVVDQIEY